MSNYYSLLHRAEHLEAEGRFADALLLLLKAVRINRHGVEAQCALAGVWERLGCLNQAIGALREALRWHSLPRMQTALARLLWRGGEADKASPLLFAALAQAPNHVEALMLWAEMLRQRGLADEAKNALLRAASSAEVTANCWPELDQALRQLGEEKAAESLFLRLLEQLPSSARTFLASLDLPGDSPHSTGHEANVGEVTALHGWNEEELNEALRRLGQRAGTADLGRSLGRQYREVVARRVLRQGGLGWPKRCGDRALRVGLLCGNWSESAARSAEHLLRGVPRAQLRLQIYAIDETAGDTAEANPASVMRLGQIPAAQAARWLVEEDCDLLLIRELTCSARALEILAHHPAPQVLGWGAVEPPLAWLSDGEFAPDEKAAERLEALLAHSEPDRAQGEWTASDLRTRWMAAVQLHQKGESVAADRMYTAILAEQGDVPRVLRLRGALRRDQGSARAALMDLQAALNGAPSYVESALDLIELLAELGAYDEALDVSSRILERVDDDPRLWRVQGIAARKAGRYQDAQQSLQRAANLNPGSASIWFNLSLAAQSLGDDEVAIDALQKAAVLDPGMPEAFYNLGALHQQRKEPERAAACYEQAIRLKPDEARAYKNLGDALFASGNYSAWLANFQRFEQRCPGSFLLAGYALEASQFMGDWSRLDSYLNGLQKQRFQPRDAAELVDGLEELLYLLLFFDFDPADMARFYRTYAEAATEIYGSPRALAMDRRAGRTRIGYLSGDVRDHVMGKMIHQWLAHHDRERFEVFLFATRPVEGAWGERIAAAAEHFEDFSRQTDDAAIESILRADLDLLVDCSTHTRGARQAILAAKPARVQITSIASAGCLGLPTIDYKLTDAFADLPESQEYQVEPFLAMTGCVYPYRHIEAAPRHGYQRERLGIAAEAVVLGAFVTLFKLSRRCLKLWREILDGVPQAVIALSPVNPKQRDAYVRVFQSAGIEPGRLAFIPQGRDESENQARYELVDFVLDPMPFGGANGTIEALDMGVPVVTLCGRRHGERVGASILTHLGVAATVAQTGPEYVSLAFRLANDHEFMANVRAQIRSALERSALTDVALHVRNLEAAYEVAIRRAHSAPSAPEGISRENSRAPVS